ncbi:MAG: nucleoside deaminase [Methanobacteriaceae archaeon]|nr:nucleoside deaminase [Methanobacteriaceae archaeon]
MDTKHHKFIQEAIKEARKSLDEGGIPIGAVLVEDGEIVGRGHNRLIRDGSTILHAEMDCLESAGKLRGADYKRCTLYTTLVPCDMCSGLILLYKIPNVVAGENETFPGPEDYLEEHDVELVNLDLDECKELIAEYIRENREVWDQEIERVS